MESSASAGHVPFAVLDRRRRCALALLSGAFVMVLLDGTITIVAPPSIGAGLRFSEQGSQWVQCVYAFTCGGLLLLGGVLGYSALKFDFSPVVLGSGPGRCDRRPGRGRQGRLPPGRRGRHGALGREVARIHAGLHTRQLLPGHLRRAARVRPGDQPGLRDRHGRGARWGRRTGGRARLGPEQHRRLCRPARRSASPSSRPLPCPLSHYLAAHKGANPLAALTEGYQSTFLNWAVLAGIGPGLARSCSPADRGSQRTSCQSRARRRMPLPQETW
jgi:hypothetical protein